MKTFTLVKNGQTYETTNLSQFCRDHELDRRNLQAVVSGKRNSYKGWMLVRPEAPLEEVGGMTTEQVLIAAEIAARAQHDPEYERMVMGRIAALRAGAPLPVVLID